MRKLTSTLQLLVLVGLLALTACADSGSARSTRSSIADSGVVNELPPESRISTGGIEPRSASYWQSWSTCGEDSRAEEAAANGGAAAGWYLVDDILQSPGVAIGDHPIESCDEALAVLTGSGGSLFDVLASLLLTAELSLNAGSESCEAAEQTVAAAQIALAGLGYAGPGSVTVDPGPAASQLIELLTAYNAGDLCR